MSTHAKGRGAQAGKPKLRDVTKERGRATAPESVTLTEKEAEKIFVAVRHERAALDLAARVAEADRLLRQYPVSTVEANANTARITVSNEIVSAMAEKGLKPSEWTPQFDGGRIAFVRRPKAGAAGACGEA